MGWSTSKGGGKVSENEVEQQQVQMDASFIDSMDAVNYVRVELKKPMGLLFEENDADSGGIFVVQIKPDGSAFENNQQNSDNIIQVGDQLVGVDGKKGWYLNLNSHDGQYEKANEIIKEYGG